MQNAREQLKLWKNKTFRPHSAEFKAILDWLSRHPSWRDKLDTIECVRIVEGKMNSNALLLRVKPTWLNRFITVSWRRCFQRRTLDRKTADAKVQLKKAMRYAIRLQVREWRKKNWLRKFCVECKSTNQIQVDHSDPSFITLVQGFLTKHADTEIPTQFAYTKKGLVKFRAQDDKFTRSWQRYHRQHAKYQWLCKSCNCKKGS